MERLRVYLATAQTPEEPLEVDPLTDLPLSVGEQRLLVGEQRLLLAEQGAHPPTHRKIRRHRYPRASCRCESASERQRMVSRPVLHSKKAGSCRMCRAS
eukprot:1180648-Prorocentrum_minimum.AAC.4